MCSMYLSRVVRLVFRVVGSVGSVSELVYRLFLIQYDYVRRFPFKRPVIVKYVYNDMPVVSNCFFIWNCDLGLVGIYDVLDELSDNDKLVFYENSDKGQRIIANEKLLYNNDSLNDVLSRFVVSRVLKYSMLSYRDLTFLIYRKFLGVRRFRLVRDWSVIDLNSVLCLKCENSIRYDDYISRLGWRLITKDIMVDVNVS